MYSRSKFASVRRHGRTPPNGTAARRSAPWLVSASWGRASSRRLPAASGNRPSPGHTSPGPPRRASVPAGTSRSRTWRRARVAAAVARGRPTRRRLELAGTPLRCTRNSPSQTWRTFQPRDVSSLVGGCGIGRVRVVRWTSGLGTSDQDCKTRGHRAGQSTRRCGAWPRPPGNQAGRVHGFGSTRLRSVDGLKASLHAVRMSCKLLNRTADRRTTIPRIRHGPAGEFCPADASLLLELYCRA